jgi:hypothetical protein
MYSVTQQLYNLLCWSTWMVDGGGGRELNLCIKPTTKCDTVSKIQAIQLSKGIMTMHNIIRTGRS